MTDTDCDYCAGTGRRGLAGMKYDCPDCGGTGRLTGAQKEVLQQRYGPAPDPSACADESHHWGTGQHHTPRETE